MTLPFRTQLMVCMYTAINVHWMEQQFTL